MLRWGIFIGALWYSVVLVAAIRNWWIPYVAGVYWGEITPEVYAHHYARNTTIFKPVRQHLVIPDVQHTLIHAAVCAAALLSWWSFLHV